MDIEEAYKVLEKYYPKHILRQLYMREKLDDSGTDTVKKHKFHAKLLREQAYKERNEEEKARLNAAARAFENLYEKERHNL